MTLTWLITVSHFLQKEILDEPDRRLCRRQNLQIDISVHMSDCVVALQNVHVNRWPTLTHGYTSETANAPPGTQSEPNEAPPVQGILVLETTAQLLSRGKSTTESRPPDGWEVAAPAT